MGLVLVETFPSLPRLQLRHRGRRRDPGGHRPGSGGEPDRVLEALSRHGLTAVALVHTHATSTTASLGAPVGGNGSADPDARRRSVALCDLARWGGCSAFPSKRPSGGPHPRHGDRVACGTARSKCSTRRVTRREHLLPARGRDPVLFSVTRSFSAPSADRLSRGLLGRPGHVDRDRILTLPATSSSFPGTGRRRRSARSRG